MQSLPFKKKNPNANAKRDLMQKHSLSHSKSLTSMGYGVPATTFSNILIGLVQYITRMVKIDSSHELARPWTNKRHNAKIRSNMNGAKPKRSRRGDGCCELLPQSIGAKKGLGLGLRLSLSKQRSQSESEDCSEPLSQSQGKINLLANL